jgi:hypothetical protein
MQVGSKGGVKCKLKYRSCKLVIEGEECNLIVQVTRMVLDTRGWERAWKEKTTLNGIDNIKCHWLLHIVSIHNGHMLLNDEQVVFELAHTFWWVNKFICH